METIITVIITLLLSAFFSGTEIAFITSNKLRIQIESEKGLYPARILSSFTKSPARFIGILLIGNNIVNVIYGISIAIILEPLIFRSLPPGFQSPVIILVAQTLVSTLFLFILSEFIPKILFRMSPNYLLNLFAVPIAIFYWILFPVSWLLTGISEWILRIFFGMRFTREDYVFSGADLDNYLLEFSPDSKSEAETRQELQIFQKAVGFKNIRLRECMVPRTEITAVEINSPVGLLAAKFVDSKHSRILVYSGSIDNITGYIHSSDMFRNPDSVGSVTRSLSVLPETIFASEVLKQMISEKKTIALVVDEFGGTSGIVTIEDIIEEIFGEIDDEYDIDEMMEKKISDHEYILAARLEIDYLNQKYDLHLPESDQYETVAGLISSVSGTIPAKNEVIHIENHRFLILQATKKRIELVKLIIQPEE